MMEPEICDYPKAPGKQLMVKLIQQFEQDSDCTQPYDIKMEPTN